MINQVTLEGFLVSRWEYKGEAFLRLAHHRPRREGELIHSDYITVRIADPLEALPTLQQGDLVRVLGEVWGKDILEPLGRVLQKAHLNVVLSPELENLIIPRPTAYILAQQVSLIDSKAEAYAKAAKRAGRPVKLREKKEKSQAVDVLPEVAVIQVT